MPEPSLYERALASLAASGEAPEAKPPRASASVVLWRRGAGGIEVYWVRRAETLPFMGGWHAFPGGGRSRSDAALEVAGTPRGGEDGPADAGMPPAVVGDLELEPPLAPGIAACALRELFEEVGLLPLDGVGGGEGAAAAELLDRLRREVAAGGDLRAALSEAGVRPDASRLVYAGRWLTPPLGPLRFDNRFFLLEWPPEAAVQPRPSSSELAAAEWIAPGRALERWERGEAIAAPPILHLLRVLAEEGPAAGRPRMLDPTECNLGPHRRIEFRPGVLLFPLATATLPPATHTNAYVLGHGDAVLVDPGSSDEDEIAALAAAVEALAEEGRPVRSIWLTHHHPDHVGGVARLRESLGVPVAAHPLTAERLRSRGIEVDEPLVDEQRVVLEGERRLSLRVLHTPGHARGHLAFLDEELGSLVVGDLVAGFGTIVVDPPEGDMDDYLASLERLRDLGPRTLFPAHGPTLLDGAGKLDEYIEHRLWREERILEAWRSGLRQPAEMLPTVYDDVPEAAHPLAERQIHAHLARLRKRGELSDD